MHVAAYRHVTSDRDVAPEGDRRRLTLHGHRFVPVAQGGGRAAPGGDAPARAAGRDGGDGRGLGHRGLRGGGSGGHDRCRALARL
ncbi:hypothetical protein, partial [Nonomuraea roseoviolacea]|uniref:hypothetical protein n=1 Tax=Nonomuraea roseoviolacea TaxID=103837 RepID=UPI0031E5367D